MKVLLISFDLILGTRILISVLKENNYEAHNVQIINIKYIDKFSRDKLNNILKCAKEYDVVGLAFNSFYSKLAKQLGYFLKSNGIKWLISGGPHPTAMPEDVVRYSDVTVIFEAEKTFPELLNRIKNKKSLNDVKGLYINSKSGITYTGTPEIEYNLDNIPFQSISTKDITYFNFKSNLFEKSKIDTLFPYGGNNYVIITSRGCPFKCTYCCNNLFNKLDKKFTTMRKRTIGNIIAEMEIAKKNGFEGIFIDDDNFFNFTLNELKEFQDLYKTKINLPFGLGGLNPNNMRAKTSSVKLDVLLNCGLSDVRIGVQSGSDKTLRYFKRNYRAKELLALLSPFDNRATIWDKPNNTLRVVIDFICDSPWENDFDKIKTLRLANNLLNTYGIFFT